MGRPVPNQILALLVVLVLVQGCQEKEELEKEAPALAHADLRVDRIAIGGVVSDVAALGDSTESRESWSSLIGDRLGRERFGKLPIMSYGEMGMILGPGDQAVMLDRFKEDGGCDDDVLAGLRTVLEGKARFIVFANIQADQVDRAEKENEVVDDKGKTTSKTRTMTTSRTTSVRLRFYDLTDRKLVWDHVAVGESVNSKSHDMSDFIEHNPKEGVLGGVLTSVANSVIKPDPGFPPAPTFEMSLTNAFDNVGLYLKPSKKK